MKIQKKKMGGMVELVPEVFEDDRGFLARVFDERVFEELGLPTVWREISHHFTKRKGILRGMYVQREPFAEGKLLRVIRGEMLWVSVDVRKNSETFGEWDSMVLSETRKNLLCTSRGFAHGCVSLTDNVDLMIQSDNFFSAEHGLGFIWNDKDVNIDWQIKGETPFISERDKEYQTFQEFKEKL